MARLLSKQDDFVNQLSMLEELIKEAHHECIFLPKFHCELNPIEMYWGWCKYRYREVQKKTFPEARRFINRSWRFMGAYRLGLTGKAAEWAVKKQKRHRQISQRAMMSIEAVLNTTMYTTCSSLRATVAIELHGVELMCWFLNHNKKCRAAKTQERGLDKSTNAGPGFLWNWSDTQQIQALGNQIGKFQVPTAKLLYFLIVESQRFGGEVLDYFWKQLETCDENLKKNSSLSFVTVESLRKEHFVSAEKSFEVLFQGLDPKNVNFDPVLKMAAEFFTHLGIAFMSPRGRKSGSFKRDGNSCLLTAMSFPPSNEPGIRPTLAHIIPNSVHSKPATLECIAMLAGAAVRDDVVSYLNNIGNAMNMQHDAHTSYDELYWGIEAKEEAGEVKYFFRMVPTNCYSNLGYITLREGDEIQFGKGPDSKKLDNGPIPILCNLQLAVARVLRMSGAADIILKFKDQADDDGCYGLSIASAEICDVLDAKLLLSGRAMVA
ncbi:hypothetical protein OG21DRAFT_1607096 [Imleria badia]|nr:hypothetical protein OG21DRAFT_1607096 [Imleria badia]